MIPRAIQNDVRNDPDATRTNHSVPGITSLISSSKILTLEEGNIIYEDSGGEGPVLVCIPGMGDTRGQFRFLAPLLKANGFRVIVIDPRGQGDSHATFSAYSSSLVGDDIVRLMDSLAVDGYLIGNSSGGASAAWAAFKRPGKVKGIVFLDAFLRDVKLNFLVNLSLQVGFKGPWIIWFWLTYYKFSFPANPPEDQEAYTAAMKASLKLEGHVKALREIIFSSKSDIESVLPEVKAPVLALAGSKDPDFENPEKELDWIKSVLKAEKVLIDGAGHYPHVEFPDQVAKIIEKFIRAC